MYISATIPLILGIIAGVLFVVVFVVAWCVTFHNRHKIKKYFTKNQKL